MIRLEKNIKGIAMDQPKEFIPVYGTPYSMEKKKSTYWIAFDLVGFPPGQIHPAI